MAMEKSHEITSTRKIKESLSRRIFVVCNYIFLTVLTIICIIPFIHLISVSLSNNTEILAKNVYLFPKGFTLEAYRYLGAKPEFFKALGVSVFRVVVGTSIQMIITFITAYPLSKESYRFRQRTAVTWFFVVTMFIGGGIMPTYYLFSKMNLIGSIWVLILPGAMNVWNVIMLLNFFRGIPRDLEEAAVVDGAGQIKILFRIFLPLAAPAIATLVLFTAVGHWNSWFDGIMFMTDVSQYPLQSYLYTMITSTDISKTLTDLSIEQIEALKQLGNQNLQSAQIFLGVLPIIIVYPFLQKYFVKGIVVGSVKG